MRALVTGAAGFVGRHLCRLLVHQGWDVYGTWALKKPSSFPENVKMLLCDVRDRRQVEKAIRKASPHHVYHLAALSSVQDSLRNSKAVYETNFSGTLNLLEAVRQVAPDARVVVVGSGQMYGRGKDKFRITENHVLNPENPYAVSKAAADLLAYQYFVTHRLWIVRARPFNHTGCGQPASYVCSDFARQIAQIQIEGKKPTLITGELNVARDFTDVRDVVRAYALLLGEGAAGEAYNVCSGKAIAIRTVVEMLSSISAVSLEVKSLSKRGRLGQPEILVGSNCKLRQATGWRPEYSIRTTLCSLLEYWRRELSNGKESYVVNDRE